MSVPARPKIYHIVHVDRLPSIIVNDALWCDAIVVRHCPPGTTIGMSDIKRRRLEELTLSSHPGLYIGQCVPFYFCPRSIMLYLLYQANHPELTYRGGQGPIIHLEADLYRTVSWANQHRRRWAFTLSNAGARYVEDRTDLAQLGEINWDAVQARRWSGSLKEGKQAEFLLEEKFPWTLIERIGVHSLRVYQQTANAIQAGPHKPIVEIKKDDWYY